MDINNQLFQRNHASVASQLAQINESTFPVQPSIASLPRLTVKKKNYILTRWLDTKRLPTSYIHEHGRLLTEIGSEGQLKDTYWLCSRCDQKNVEIIYEAT